MAPYLDLMCMGAAFLLLETKNVVQFALLFGTTWFVNAFVFGGVLLSVLAAVAMSKRVRIRRTGLLYAVLLGAIAVNWLVPGPRPARAVERLPAWWSPSSWRSPRSSSPTSCSPSASATPPRRRPPSAPTCSAPCSAGSPSTCRSIVGYRHLLLVVAALYAAAFLLRPRRPMDVW